MTPQRVLLYGGISLAAILAAFSLGAVPAGAAEVMPSFAGAPTGWAVDRYAPDGFNDIGTFQFAPDVLDIHIGNAGEFANRTAGFNSSFYDTQGMSHPTAGGNPSTMSAYLYVPSSWASPLNGYVRTDEWGTTVNGAKAVVDYPIIGFTNFGAGGARFEAWDEKKNGWVDLAAGVSYDWWNLLTIDWDGTNFTYSVNGVQQAIIAGASGAVGFSSVIMEAVNRGQDLDPAYATAVFAPYDARWANSVPEPASLALIASGLIGLGAIRSRRRRSD